MHFFWGVDRMTAEELSRAQLVTGQEDRKFNVALRGQEFATMAKCMSSAPMRVCSAVAPTMHNTVPLARGDRLILRITEEKKAPDAAMEKDADMSASCVVWLPSTSLMICQPRTCTCSMHEKT